MKICHITTAHNALDTRIFYKQCQSLQKKGYDVYLIAHGESNTIEDVKIKGIGELPKNVIKRMLTSTRKAYNLALKNDANIYQIHDPELLPYAMKLKRRGKIVIYDCHEDYDSVIAELNFGHKSISKIVSKLFRFYFYYCYKRLDAVITVSPHVVDKIKDSCRKLWMITNYPIINQHETLETSIKKQGQIAFAGGIKKIWSHENIIKAISNIENATYILCGPISKKYLSTLESLRGWSKTKYLGKIDFNEVHKIYSESLCAAVLLDYIGNAGWKKGTLGNTKIFESMYAGIPVVCTDFELWNDMIIKKYNCGIAVDPNDVQAIEEALRYLISNPDIAKAMGDNGRRAVIEEFNWQTQEEILYELYDELSKEKV